MLPSPRPAKLPKPRVRPGPAADKMDMLGQNGVPKFVGASVTTSLIGGQSDTSRLLVRRLLPSLPPRRLPGRLLRGVRRVERLA